MSCKILGGLPIAQLSQRVPFEQSKKNPLTAVFRRIFHPMRRREDPIKRDISTAQSKSKGQQVFSTVYPPSESKEGGQGIVTFRPKQHGSPEAVKVITKRVGDTDLREVRFTQLANGCRHGPHYQKAEIVEGKVVLVTDQVGQADLTEILFSSKKNGTFTLEQTLKIAKQGLEFLCDLHAKRVVHGDIHPNNIVWDDKARQCHIIDFGLSKSIDEEKKGWKPLYMSPEVKFQMKSAPSQDIWTLGLTLFELFTGKDLFDKKKVDHLTPLKFEEVLQREFGEFSQSMIKRMDEKIRDEVFDLKNGFYFSKNKKVKRCSTWEEKIRNSRNKGKDTPRSIERFIEFLGEMFDYASPKTAQVLLKHNAMEKVDIAVSVMISKDISRENLYLVFDNNEGEREIFPVSNDTECIHVRPSYSYSIQFYRGQPTDNKPEKNKLLPSYKLEQGSVLHIRK